MADVMLEAGRKILIRNPNDEEWHERILIRVGSPRSVLRVTGTAASPGVSHWWVLTPDGDVYPEGVGAPDVAEVVVCGVRGRTPR
eukprot:15411231-Heterocapsa_arctica.AAC.1